MSLLAILASTTAVIDPPDPPDPVDVDDAIPYALPQSPPWNVSQPLSLPSGQSVHPSVIDFATQYGGAGAWNGYRFWMAVTPYTYGNAGQENPFIFCSHNGVDWVTPSGLTNPIDPPPGASGYNSDTDLAFDTATGRMWCFWREHDHGADPDLERIHTSWSTNGSTWNKTDNIVVAQQGIDGAVSPCVQKVGVNDWRMLTVGGEYRTASNPTGPWTTVGTVSWTWGPAGPYAIWHFGMTLVDGVLYGLADCNTPEHVFAATSSDGGLSWSVSSSPVIQANSGGWDNRPYRATLTPHENGTHMRVWYSACGVSDGTGTPWHVGFTHVPITAWPSPPA